MPYQVTAFNRTSFGIEMHLRGIEHVVVKSFNRTSFGIEI